MVLIVEGIVMCFVLLIICVIGIACKDIYRGGGRRFTENAATIRFILDFGGQKWCNRGVSASGE